MAGDGAVFASEVPDHSEYDGGVAKGAYPDSVMAVGQHRFGIPFWLVGELRLCEPPIHTAEPDKETLAPPAEGRGSSHFVGQQTLAWCSLRKQMEYGETWIGSYMGTPGCPALAQDPCVVVPFNVWEYLL